MDSTAHSVHGGKVIIGAHNVNRLQVRFPAPPSPPLLSATLGKLLTHVFLLPSSTIWYQPMGGKRPCGWEGNHTSGVALAMPHIH